MIHLHPHVVAVVKSVTTFVIALIVLGAICRAVLFLLDIWFDRRYKWRVVYANGRVSRGQIKSKRKAILYAESWDGVYIYTVIRRRNFVRPKVHFVKPKFDTGTGLSLSRFGMALVECATESFTLFEVEDQKVVHYITTSKSIDDK